MHYDYLVAWVDVITTASYQATFAGFGRRGMSEAEAAGLMRRSVELAWAARDDFWAEPASVRAASRPCWRLGRPLWRVPGRWFGVPRGTTA